MKSIRDYSNLMLLAITLQLVNLIPLPLQTDALVSTAAATPYQTKVRALAAADSYSQQQLINLRPQTKQQSELAALLPYATPSQARLIAILASGCAQESMLCDALLQLAVRSRNTDVRLACLLAPLSVPARYLPSLATLALSSELDLGLRSVACGRILEHQLYSAWPLARAILLTGTATDSQQANPFPDWLRSGRYELAKRLLCILLKDHFEVTHQTEFIFEPNAAWAVQEQQIAIIDKMINGCTAQENTYQKLSSWSRLSHSQSKTTEQVKLLLGL